ncbi:hypothetical protein Taro_000753 [Colocasia esculenta]|uniref:TFIIB-type domain-containing protein n=1 Tax=Colocasia esculenta TaxID=4460 RepID=A0A843THC9_COLES|nr:hypothetical protein [Colocasia esculenta]
MPWCKHCQEVCPTIRDEDRGYICCQGCGRVLDQDIYFSGVTFEKTSSGQSRLAGAFIRSVQSEYSLSHERTLLKEKEKKVKEALGAVEWKTRFLHSGMMRLNAGNLKNMSVYVFELKCVTTKLEGTIVRFLCRCGTVVIDP